MAVEQDLRVQLEDNVLSLYARIDSPVPAGARLLHEEYRLGDYQRSVILGDEVDRERITAELTDGCSACSCPRPIACGPAGSRSNRKATGHRQRPGPNVHADRRSSPWSPTMPQSSQSPPDAQLVPVRVADSTPFFFLPGSGDTGRVAIMLAGYLDLRQTIYTADLVRPFRQAGPPPEIESLAASLLTEIRSIQPRGPYYLGGYSLGGVVSFEMARKLRALGEQVGLLALVDAYGPNFPRSVSRLGREWRHWQQMRELSLAGKLRYLADRFGKGNRWLKRLRRARTVPDAAQATATKSHEEGLAAVWPAIQRYFATRPIYQGSIILLRAVDQPSYIGHVYDDPESGWGAVARGGVRVVPIPGAHATVFREPGALAIAEVLHTLLPNKTPERAC
jgi:thioesterase domain-containing protein